MTARRRVPPLEASVKREIASAERSVPGSAKSWRSELALNLAREIETAGEDAPLAARVSAGKLLAETMTQIQAVASSAPKADRLDELATRRTRRKAS